MDTKLATFSANEIIEQLHAKGVYCYLQSGKLKTKSEPGAITKTIAEQIKHHKQAIIAHLCTQQIEIIPSLKPQNKYDKSDERHENNKNDERTPLSFAQGQLWLIDHIDGSSAQYNMPQMMRLTGNLNQQALQQAFDEIIKRHHILRTTYHYDGEGEPIQQVHQCFSTLPIPVIDITNINQQEQTTKIHKLFTEESQQPFDLKNDLMVRVHLYQTAKNDYLLFITLHHIATDGWSMSILIQEFMHLYQSYCDGKAHQLPVLSLQYADYARWQRDWLQEDVLATQLNYWQEQLHDMPILHRLPLDARRPKIQGTVGKKHLTTINQILTQQLKTLTVEAGGSLFMGLHAAFSAYLAHYSQTRDIIVGTPIANREQPEIAPLIGYFNNSLVLRSQLHDNPNFVNLIAQSKTTLFGAYAHQQVPFQKLVEDLQPQRSLSFNPLFQIALVLQNYGGETLQLPGLEIHAVDTDEIGIKCDLTVNIAETETGLALSWIYDTALFKAETITSMAQHFEHLLQQLVAQPQIPVFEHSLLLKTEKKQQLITWNQTQTTIDLSGGIHERVEYHAAKQPEALALSYEDKQLSYAELNQQANQLAHYLIHEREVTPDTLIGVYFDRSIQLFISILAVLKAGAAYLPFDPDHPEERLLFMQEDSGVSTILTESSLLFYSPLDPTTLLCIDDEDFSINLHNYAITNPIIPEFNQKHLAYCIYTSGSTGQPKGVMLNHQGVNNLSFVQQQQFALSPAAKVLQFASISFDAASWEWVMALTNGASLHLCTDEARYQGNQLADQLTQNKITHATLPPAVLKQLPFHQDYALEYLIIAGEKCDSELATQWASSYHLINAYGPTETTVCATMGKVGTQGVSVIGQPLPNFQCYVLSPDKTLLPVGVVGELYVAGVGLARSYLHQPELTAERFIEHDFSEYQVGLDQPIRLYRTGDLVRWLDSGQLEYIGRDDHQIKIRGCRVELEEIESSLLAINEIDQGLIIIAPGPDGNKNIIGYYQSKTQITSGLIKSQLQTRLPDYMIPTILMSLHEFPITTNGKIDRDALPEPDFSQVQTHYLAPRNDIEKTLCTFWENTLNVERVGVQDNFFDLGGHSLMVTNLLARVQQEFAVEILVKDVFAHPCVEKMAELIAIERQLITLATDEIVDDGEDVWEL